MRRQSKLKLEAALIELAKAREEATGSCQKRSLKQKRENKAVRPSIRSFSQISHFNRSIIINLNNFYYNAEYYTDTNPGRSE